MILTTSLSNASFRTFVGVKQLDNKDSLESNVLHHHRILRRISFHSRDRLQDVLGEQNDDEEVRGNRFKKKSHSRSQVFFLETTCLSGVAMKEKQH